MKAPRYEPPRLGGVLSLAAGFLFIVLAVVRGQPDPVRLFLGVALVILGLVWSKPPEQGGS